ncbi:hypothetical protein [Paenibacillus sp.]|uniref:hypothetical protein n=1 Tax=Paenibacillus sp. TaxID=58172 RepID=UPI002D226373|nr:hypothetical protein [Paenibacillus sp.]HZG84370.1 hypothetical protein [Paenibacillus sp.]
MVSRKSYLYGLGTGLIAGSVLLQLASIGESSAGPMSEAQLEAAAAASGYVLKDARVAWFTEQQMQERAAEAERRLRAELEAEGAIGAAPEDAAKPAVVYAFTVGSGSELKDVAKLVYELGLVDDYNGFLFEMQERGLAGKVQAKHYRFDRVPTTDELIEALTTP